MTSRRDFLQKLAAPLAAIPFLPKGQLSFNNISNKPYQGPILRVAVMGIGTYGIRMLGHLMYYKEET